MIGRYSSTRSRDGFTLAGCSMDAARKPQHEHAEHDEHRDPEPREHLRDHSPFGARRADEFKRVDNVVEHAEYAPYERRQRDRPDAIEPSTRTAQEHDRDEGRNDRLDEQRLVR